MKKFLLIASIIFIPLQALAFEDYIIVSEKPVHSVVLLYIDICFNVNVMPEATTFKCPDELACFPLDRVDNEKKEDK